MPKGNIKKIKAAKVTEQHQTWTYWSRPGPNGKKKPRPPHEKDDKKSLHGGKTTVVKADSERGEGNVGAKVESDLQRKGKSIENVAQSCRDDSLTKGWYLPPKKAGLCSCFIIPQNQYKPNKSHGKG